MANWFAQLFGSRNQRLVSSYTKNVGRINALEESYKGLSDAQLQAKTAEFRQRLGNGEKLDDLLADAFAAAREAARRTLGMRHFDVQLIGGMVLHQGKISEMRTGEGKTLMSTLGAYLNALPGKGVHVVTVNEYLAQRDADWMGPVYQFLGLTVGVIKSGQTSEEKRAAYACDITYGTNNEFGFDYLRDNLAFRLEDRTQRGLAYAIVPGRRRGEGQARRGVGDDAGGEGGRRAGSRRVLGDDGEPVGLLVDCDDDSLLVQVKRLGDGNVCHTGERTCFYRELPNEVTK